MYSQKIINKIIKCKPVKNFKHFAGNFGDFEEDKNVSMEKLKAMKIIKNADNKELSYYAPNLKRFKKMYNQNQTKSNGVQHIKLI